MGTAAIEIARKPRADAARNRERVLRAATAVFSAGGADASLEAVARRAGVGIGTLYRHFPTREALFEAVYRHEVQHLSDLAAQLKDDPSPLEALRQWLRAAVEFVATKRGMVQALAIAVTGSSELHTKSSAQMAQAAAVLIKRAIEAGEIRADIAPDSLVRALIGMCYMHNQPGWQASVLHLVDILVNGLRVDVSRGKATRGKHKTRPTAS